MMESMNNGNFLSLSETAAYEFSENLSDNSQQWDFSSQRDLPLQSKTGGIYEVREDTETKQQLNNLSRKLEALTLKLTTNSINQIQTEVCTLCASPMHVSEMCPSLANFPNSYSEQANALNNYEKPFPSPYSETYNQNW